MRIALFTETYLPHINGVVTHVKSLKDGLERLGHQVLVVCADAQTHRHYLDHDILRCPAVTSKKFYGYGLSTPISTTRINYIRKFCPDVIHVHNEFGIGMSGMIIAKMLNIAMVYTLHTMYDEYIYYVAPPSLTNVATKFSHKYFNIFANAAQGITGPSKKCEEYFQRAGLNKPVTVIPNPVDLDLFDPDKLDPEKIEEIRISRGYSGQDMVGVFVGRLGHEKSVDVMLDYWKESIRPDEHIRLLIIGDGPCKDALEAQAHDLGIDNMVQFAGKIMHSDIPPYLGGCQFYITTSTSDTNSISMLEGMACGLPVLQITDPLNEGQVRDGVNGFIFGSAQEMGDCIRKLRALDKEDADKLRASSRQSVAQSGAINLAQYVLNVYEGAIQQMEPSNRRLNLKLKRALRLRPQRETPYKFNLNQLRRVASFRVRKNSRRQDIKGDQSNETKL